MADDKSQDQAMSDYERLEHSLWIALACMCECCDHIDDYPASPDAHEDPITWAKIVAPRAQADGWTAPDVGVFLCPDCRAKGVDWQKDYTPPPDGGIRAADREQFQRWLDSETDRWDFKFKPGKSYLWLFPIIFPLIGVAAVAIASLTKRADLAVLAIPGFVVGISLFEVWSGVVLDSWWRASHPRGTASYYGIIAWQLVVAVAFTCFWLTIE